MDASKQLLAFDDEAGVRYAYTYDALGRVRSISLPDGTTHAARYDDYGRVWRVERGGIATVETLFDAVTGLVTTKRYLSPGGTLERSVHYDYDAIGRVVVETHTDVASGASKTSATSEGFGVSWGRPSPSQPT